MTDFPALFGRQTPPEMIARVTPVLELATTLHTIVSPLHFDPRTSVMRRFIAAGLVDRLVDPVEQVAPLWHHWHKPSIHWYSGGHIGYAVRRDVRWFVDAAFIRSGVFHLGTVRVGA